MLNKFLFFALCILLITACDKVKDSAEPDVWSSFELKTIQTNTFVNGSTEIDILGQNQLPVQATIRISRQPQHGQISFNSSILRFVYTPETNWFGKDSAEFEACHENNCKTGNINLEVTDTTTPCQIIVPNYSLSVLTGYRFLSTDSVFNCGGKIERLIGSVPSAVRLENGRIKINFPDQFQDSVSFSFEVCSQSSGCVTGTIKLMVNPDPVICQNQFVLNPDIIKIASNVQAKSIAYDSLYINDRSCPGDLIYESLQVTEGPKNGRFELRSNIQGRFLRYFKDETFIAGTDSISYNVSSSSGSTKSTKVYIKVQ